MNANEALERIDKLYEDRHNIVDSALRTHLLIDEPEEISIETFLKKVNLWNNRILELTWKEDIFVQSGAVFVNKTPDIQFYRNGVWHVIEVSVSAKPSESRVKKHSKYSYGLEAIATDLQVQVEFQIVSSNSEGTNLPTEYPGIRWGDSIAEIEKVNEEIRKIRTSEVKESERGIFERLFLQKFKGKDYKNISLDGYDVPNKDYYEEKYGDRQEVKDWIIKALTEEGVSTTFTRPTEEGINALNDLTKEVCSTKFDPKPISSMYAYCLASRQFREPPMTKDLQRENLLTSSKLVKTFPKNIAQCEIAKGLLAKVESFSLTDWYAWTNNSPTLQEKTIVKQPGCLKLKSSEISSETNDFLKKMKKKTCKEEFVCNKRDSMPKWDYNYEAEAFRSIGKLEKSLQQDLEITGFERPRFGNTNAEGAFSTVYNAEMKARILEPLCRSRGFQSCIVLRDVAEWLISSSGNKRSKEYSIYSGCGGELIVVKLPSKSIESIGGKIKFFWIASEGVSLSPQCDFEHTFSGEFQDWHVSKVVTMDLKRVDALASAPEAVQMLVGSISAKMGDSEGRIPSFDMIRQAGAKAILVATSPKNSISGLLDCFRYAINSCFAESSGWEELMKTTLTRPLNNDLEFCLEQDLTKLCSKLPAAGKEMKVSKIKIIQGSVSKATFGASGKIPSFLFPGAEMGDQYRWHKKYSQLVAEIYGLFFLLPKGLHGWSEDLAILEETVEWMRLFESKEEKFGKNFVKYGYSITDPYPQQQLYCEEFMALLGHWVSDKVLGKREQIKSEISRAGLLDNYYRNPRNRSTKGMTEPPDEYNTMNSISTIQKAAQILKTTEGGETVLTKSLKSLDKNVNARLVRKYQRTEHDRGIFVCDESARARLQPLEKVAMAIAKPLEEEMISVPGDHKMLEIQRALEKALRWASSEAIVDLYGREFKMKKSLIFVSCDATKWSPGDNLMKFYTFIGNIDGCFDEKMKNYLLSCLESCYETRLGIPETTASLLRTLVGEKGSKTAQLKDFFSIDKGASVGTIRGNWLQGNLNLMSSLVGVASANYGGEIAKEICPEVVGFFLALNHSDDACFIIGTQTPEDVPAWIGQLEFEKNLVRKKIMKAEDPWKFVMKCTELTARLASIKYSPKKTFISRTVAEFVGTLFEGGNPTVAWVKQSLSALSEIKVQGYQKDFSAVASSAVKVLDLSGSLQAAQLCLELGTQRVQRAYGVQRGMINDPCEILRISPQDIPICLGGGSLSSILSIATGGPLYSDVLAVRNARENSDEYGRRVMQIYKHCENNFVDPDNKSFKFGNLDWRIFSPKDPVRESEIISDKEVEAWREAFPEYQFVIPNDQKNLLYLTVSLLKRRDILCALTKQSALALRFRMFSRVNGEVVKAEGQWVSLKKLLESVCEKSKKEEITIQDIERWDVATEMAFSKIGAWHEIFTTTTAEMVGGAKRQTGKIPRIFLVKEDMKPIVNSISSVMAFSVSKTNEGKSLIRKEAKDSSQLQSDSTRLRKAVFSRLGWDISDLKEAIKAYPYLSCGDVRRVVLAPSNSELTSQGIVEAWLRDMSFTRVVKVHSDSALKAATHILSERDSIELEEQEHAARLIVSLWKFSKVNNISPFLFLQETVFKGQTLNSWVSKISWESLRDSKSQYCVFLLEHFKLTDPILEFAKNKVFGGKFYTERQIYDKAEKTWKGNLNVTFAYGSSQAVLKIIDGKYFVKSSCKEKSTVTHMMRAVSNELKGAGMIFDVVRAGSVRGIRCIKDKDVYYWGKPSPDQWIVNDVLFDGTLPKFNQSNAIEKVNLSEDGLAVTASLSAGKPVRVSSCYKSLPCVPYSSVTMKNNFVVQGVNMKEIVTRGLLGHLVQGLGGTLLTRTALGCILKNPGLPARVKSIIEVLNDFGGEIPRLEESTTVGTDGFSRWGDDEEDEFDLDELDFESYLDDESSFINEDIFSEIELEIEDYNEKVEVPRGIIKYDDMQEFVKSWGSREYYQGTEIDPLDSALFFRAVANLFLLTKPLNIKDRWLIDSLDNALGKMAEEVISGGPLKLLEAAKVKRKKDTLWDLRPYKGFDLEKVISLLSKLFQKKDNPLFF